jgi:hypothetical protein
MEFVDWNRLNRAVTGCGDEFKGVAGRSKPEKAHRRNMISALKELGGHMNQAYYSGDLVFYTTGNARGFRSFRTNIIGAALSGSAFGTLLIPADGFERAIQKLSDIKPTFSERLQEIRRSAQNCIARDTQGVSEISVQDGIVPSRHRGMPRRSSSILREPSF